MSAATEVINVRIPAEQKAIIDNAAQLLGKSRTAFILELAVRHAEEILAEKTHFQLSPGTVGCLLGASGCPGTSQSRPGPFIEYPCAVGQVICPLPRLAIWKNATTVNRFAVVSPCWIPGSKSVPVGMKPAEPAAPMSSRATMTWWATTRWLLGASATQSCRARCVAICPIPFLSCCWPVLPWINLFKDQGHRPRPVAGCHFTHGTGSAHRGYTSYSGPCPA